MSEPVSPVVTTPAPAESPVPAALPAASPTPEAVAATPVAVSAPVMTTPPRRRAVFWSFVRIAVLLVVAAATLAVTKWNWSLHSEYEALRNTCLWLVVITGLTATLCVGGMIRCLDRLLDLQPRPHWIWRSLIELSKRPLMVLQLGTTGWAILAAAVLILRHDVSTHLF